VLGSLSEETHWLSPPNAIAPDDVGFPYYHELPVISSTACMLMYAVVALVTPVAYICSEFLRLLPVVV
jgi:hypothetical protein